MVENAELYKRLPQLLELLIELSKPFCKLFNKGFICLDAFGVNGDCIACPLYHFIEALRLMEAKRLPMSHALALTLTSGMEDRIKRQILHTSILRDKEIYPKKSLKGIRKELEKK